MSKALEAFRTISEVADDLDVPKHVLRFWEVKFPQIRPMKRGGGRRYYRPEDLVLLRGIQHLLHAEGYTIKGVQKILREQGVEQVKHHGHAGEDQPPAAMPKAASAPATGAGRVRVLAKAIKSPVTARLPDALRAAIEAAVGELQATREVLLRKTGVTAQPASSTQPVRGRAASRSARSPR